jgi:hypothetical protein
MSCKAMGQTDEAAKYACCCCFAMLDYYSLIRLFLSTTPDDECSFRIRLHAKLHDWVSELTTIYSISELFALHKILSLFCFSHRYVQQKIFKKGKIFLYHTELTTNSSISKLCVSHKFLSLCSSFTHRYVQ